MPTSTWLIRGARLVKQSHAVCESAETGRRWHSGGNGKVDGLISNTANYNVFVEPYMTRESDDQRPARALHTGMV